MKKILYIATEAVPFAASGGLGDVIGSLPAAIKAESNCDIRVVMPLYSAIPHEHRQNMKYITNFYATLGWRRQYCGIFSLEKGGVTYYFLDNLYYYDRYTIYGNYDDAERFAFFCRAALEMMPVIDFFPDILHAHDWQSALSVIYLKRHFSYDERYRNIKAVFTIHNILYQGIYGLDILSDVLALGEAEKNVVEYHGDINLMKGAIVLADKITTVSRKYAEEIQSEEYSHGLSGILRENSYKLCGIVNGIDCLSYDPESDSAIYCNYNAECIEKKTENKLAFQREFGLPQREDVPLFAIVSRLTEQKGLSILKPCLCDMMAGDIQLAVLGCGEYMNEEFFHYLKCANSDKVSEHITFCAPLSRKIYAAADIFLMPSKTEPCGLAQMIASRYGTIPVVRETGGLYDTIRCYNKYTDEGDGFTFYEYSKEALKGAVDRALELYYQKEVRLSLMRRIMKKDFSWNASAREYISLYNNL